MDDTSQFENCVFCSIGASGRAHVAASPLDAITDKIAAHFKALCPRARLYIYEKSKRHFVASVLLNRTKDIQKCETKGVFLRLAESVYEELQRGGIGSRSEISVEVISESKERLREKNRTQQVPTPEGFSRADALDKERSRNLSAASEEVRLHFSGVYPIHDVWILPEGDVDFRAYVFFEKDKDVDRCKVNRAVPEIIDFVYDSLERAGRGRRGDITVGFEFDSHENVLANYAGNYFFRRLR